MNVVALPVDQNRPNDLSTAGWSGKAEPLHVGAEHRYWKLDAPVCPGPVSFHYRRCYRKGNTITCNPV